MEIMKNYRSIFNLVSDGVYIRKDDTIIFSNPTASKIFSGCSDSNLEGRRLRELIRPDAEYSHVYKEFLNKIETEEEIKAVHLRVIRVYDGKEIDIELSGKKIIYHEEEAYLQIVKDISEKLQTERYKKEYEKSQELLKEAADSEKARTDFFANLSHEFRTPLNVILGIVQLQDQAFKNSNEKRLREDYKRYNEVLKQNCYRLLRMINNLLDMTKIEAGYLTLNLRNGDIASVIENITMSVVDYAKTRGINIIFDTDVEEKLMAFDADNMERIILNLLSNAVKFTPSGKSIYVTVKDLVDSIIISIKDEGEGIPRDKQSAIFNRFIQAGMDYNKRSIGTGIGLSLVKSLVELHDGAISLRSEVGKGSEFIISLPVKLVEESSPEASQEVKPEGNVERVSIEFSDIYNTDR